MPYNPWFPEPGTYIRYLAYESGQAIIKYRKLLWRRAPLRYPYRFASVAAGGTLGTGTTFEDLNPATKAKKHIYLAYLGVRPGFLYHIYHPYDIKILKWDEGTLVGIDENLTAALTYEDSPYDLPTFALGIEEDRYPNVTPRNISNRAMKPEIMWTAALYRIKEYEELSDDERQKLESGALRSYPWDFGGSL